MSWWDRLTHPGSRLRGTAWERREQVAEIHKAGDPGAARTLVSALADEDEGVRRAAAEALGDIRSPEAIRPLAALLTQTGVGEVAARALVRYGRDGADAALEYIRNYPEFVNAAHVAGALKDSRAAPALVARLGENFCGDAAVDALAAIGPASLPALAGVMVRAGEYARLDAVRAAGRIGGPEAYQLLVRALGDENGRVREAAMIGVGTHGGADAVPRLARLLASAPDIEKWYAADALALTGAAAAVGPLVRCLGTDAADEYLTEHVATALGKLGDRAAVGPLKPFLARGPLKQRRTVLAALEELGWRPDGPEERGLAAAARSDFTDLATLGAGAAGPLVDLLLGTWELAGKRAAHDSLEAILGARAGEVAADVLTRMGALGTLEGGVPFTAYRDSWDEEGHTEWATGTLDCGPLAAAARAELLRRRDPARGESGLIAELSAVLPELRLEAAKELAAHRSMGAAAALARTAVLDASREVADCAARSLASHGEAGFHALQPYLAARDAETRVRAVVALAPFPADSALAGLGLIVNDGDDDVREAVVGRLVAIDRDAAIPVLMRVLAWRKRRHRKLAIEALIRRGEAAAAMLLDGLDEPDRRFRYGVLSALEGIAPSAAAGPLIRLLDADPRYARAAVTALGAVLARHGHALARDMLETLARLADRTQRGWRPDEADERVDCGAIRARAEDALRRKS